MTSIGLWLAAYFLEFVLFIPIVWRQRRFLVFPIALAGALTAFALTLYFSWVALLVILPLLVFRIGNAFRIYTGRMNEKYLHSVALRTSLSLFVIHFIGGSALYLALHFPLGLAAQLGEVVLATVALASALHNMHKLQFVMPDQFLADRDLPTVTVAIPARNETQDLEECIRTVLASDYPKLEVLVLDDCSQISRTAEIIRSFAHDGVRFIKGKEPNDRWLAKNQAYEQLYQNSSAEILIFCGVDVRFGSGTIRAMVNLFHARKKKMVSVLPLRVTGAINNTLFQPMRYWWELALPRRAFNRPPVLSTCWMIERDVLEQHGGFAAISRNITPERYFARELIKTDGYSFVRNSEDIDVRTQKSMTEQRSTTVRLRYPQLRKRPENVLLLVALEVYLFVCPLVALLIMLASAHYGFGFYLSLIAILELMAVHIAILQVSNPANLGMAILTFPTAILTEVFMNLVSMYRYEFGTVEWKDRNICIPVMHVIPHLPKVE